MKYCTYCGNPMADEAVVCVKCGCSVGIMQIAQPQYQNTIIPYKEDKPEAILIIVSILFPIIGIIMGYIVSSDSPVAGRAYRKAGWIAILIEFCCYLFIMLVSLLF